MDDQLGFLKEHERGIYRVHLLRSFVGEMDEEEYSSLSRRLAMRRRFGSTYVPTMDEFFQRWMNGRFDKKPNLDDVCRGFELQLPQVKFDPETNLGSICGLVIASDLSYSDIGPNHLIFAINDVGSERVLAYHDDGAEILKSDPFGKKELVERETYPSRTGPEKYPFESINLLKSVEYTWTLVHITPHEVYSALRKIGFCW